MSAYEQHLRLLAAEIGRSWPALPLPKVLMPIIAEYADYIAEQTLVQVAHRGSNGWHVFNTDFIFNVCIDGETRLATITSWVAPHLDTDALNRYWVKMPLEAAVEPFRRGEGALAEFIRGTFVAATDDARVCAIAHELADTYAWRLDRALMTRVAAATAATRRKKMNKRQAV